MNRSYRRGDRPRARDINGILDAASRETRGGGPVAVASGTGGRMFQLVGYRPFWAKITGPPTSTGFPFHAVCGEPPVQCGPDLAGAREVNGAEVEADSIVRIYPTAFDFRFSAPCVGEVKIQVKGCDNKNVPGARVTVLGVSGYTDSQGMVTLPVPPGPQVVVVESIGFETYTGTRTLSCKVVTVVTLTPQTYYHCTCCPRPMPETVYYTNSYGTATLTWKASRQMWFGKQTIPLIAARIHRSLGGVPTVCHYAVTTGTADVTICWAFYRAGGGVCRLEGMVPVVCENCTLIYVQTPSPGYLSAICNYPDPSVKRIYPLADDNAFDEGNHPGPHWPYPGYPQFNDECYFDGLSPGVMWDDLFVGGWAGSSAACADGTVEIMVGSGGDPNFFDMWGVVSA